MKVALAARVALLTAAIYAVAAQPACPAPVGLAPVTPAVRRPNLSPSIILLVFPGKILVADVDPPPALPIQQTMPTIQDSLDWIVTSEQSMLFATTEGGKLYSSKNNGKSWLDETPNLMSKTPKSSDKVLTLVTSSEDDPHANVIVQGFEGEHWGSKDLGANWIQPCGVVGADPANCFADPTNGVGFVYSLFKMHPKLPDHLLVLVERDLEPDSEYLALDLMYSADFGKSWQNLTETAGDRVWGFVDFDFAPPVPGDMDDGMPGIMATVYESEDDMKDGYYSPWDYNVHFVYSTDLFKTAHQRRVMCGNSFEVLNGDVYVAQLRDCLVYHATSDAEARAEMEEDTDIVLQISTDAGKTFTQACVPSSLGQQGYTVYDWNKSEPGPDFLSVDHTEISPARNVGFLGNLYSADVNMQFFSLNMRDNIRIGGSADFTNVAAIPGVYLANQVIGHAMTMDSVKTRITYNAGGVWQGITPPLLGADGKRINCQEGPDSCELHLHGETHWMRGSWKTRLGSVYTHESAPGVILATGNVGKSLAFDPTSVNTYLSRDAGVTWEEIVKGPHIYEFGNNGGLIVIGKMSSLGTTNKIQFSRDLGRCWEDLELSQTISIHNIRSDPGGKGDVFIVRGSIDDGTADGDADGVMFTIDFNSLLQKDANGAATYAWSPARCEPKDYEQWAATSPNPDKCILGRNATFTRRMRDPTSACLNRADYVRPEPVTKACECSEQYDTECEFGWERPNPLAVCERMKTVDFVRECPAMEGREISATNMRIIAGSSCVDETGALGRDRYRVDGTDDGKGKHRGHGVLAFFLWTFFIVAIGGAGYWAYNQYDLGQYVPMEVKQCVNGVWDKINELMGRRSAAPAGYFEPLGDFDADEL